MPAEPITRSLIKSSVAVIRLSWRPLVLTDVAFKLIAFIVLTPLVGVLFRALLALSGSDVVSDLDIVFFLFGPVGWICAIGVGAMSLGIMALEQASLMAIIGAKSAATKSVCSVPCDSQRPMRGR